MKHRRAPAVVAVVCCAPRPRLSVTMCNFICHERQLLLYSLWFFRHFVRCRSSNKRATGNLLQFPLHNLRSVCAWQVFSALGASQGFFAASRILRSGREVVARDCLRPAVVVPDPLFPSLLSLSLSLCLSLCLSLPLSLSLSLSLSATRVFTTGYYLFLLDCCRRHTFPARSLPLFAVSAVKLSCFSCLHTFDLSTSTSFSFSTVSKGLVVVALSFLVTQHTDLSIPVPLP